MQINGSRGAGRSRAQSGNRQSRAGRSRSAGRSGAQGNNNQGRSGRSRSAGRSRAQSNSRDQSQRASQTFGQNVRRRRSAEGVPRVSAGVAGGDGTATGGVGTLVGAPPRPQAPPSRVNSNGGGGGAAFRSAGGLGIGAGGFGGAGLGAAAQRPSRVDSGGDGVGFGSGVGPGASSGSGLGMGAAPSPQVPPTRDSSANQAAEIPAASTEAPRPQTQPSRIDSSNVERGGDGAGGLGGAAPRPPAPSSRDESSNGAVLTDAIDRLSRASRIQSVDLNSPFSSAEQQALKPFFPDGFDKGGYQPARGSKFTFFYSTGLSGPTPQHEYLQKVLQASTVDQRVSEHNVPRPDTQQGQAFHQAYESGNYREASELLEKFDQSGGVRPLIPLSGFK